jgi:hypothetical protein
MRTFSVYLLGLLFLLSACKDKPKTLTAFNPSYGAHINSFTSGIISKKSSINIYFNQDADMEANDVIRFEPEIEGELSWVNTRHLQFIPSDDLTPGEVYEAELELADLIKVPDSLKTFSFGFQVLKTDFDWGQVALEASPSTQMEYYQLRGNVIGADEEELESLKDLLEVTSDNTDYTIRWFNGSGLREYQFIIDSIQRKDEAFAVKLSLSKNESSIKLEEKSIEIPAMGDFKFLGYDKMDGREREIVLKFSDPIDAQQDLKGLITLEGVDNLKLEVNNTQIKLLPPDDFYGKRSLGIFEGIKNIGGYKLKEGKTIEVDFQSEKPQIAFLGDGHILPQSTQTLLPFKAISLKAVDVKVVRINSGNMLQFLQNNELEGSRELYRVGEVIKVKTIDLSKAGKTLTDWSNYAINLAELVKTEPGALYRVYLSFKKEYSVYPDCDDFNTEETDEGNDYYYDDYYYDDYYYDEYYGGSSGAYNREDFYFSYPRGYNWRERDNPCHVSYFNQDRFATRNILVSDLGVIVKKNDKEEYDFTVTDLKSTNPISGAKVELLSYQQQSLGNGSTDANGFAKISLNNPKKQAFFAKIEKGDQRNYVKLSDGYSLSLSAFDVSGTKVDKGLKGFIYGERGVWRPGDSLFLNFILEDQNGSLPKDFPVVFELTDPRGNIVDRQVNKRAVGRIYDFTSYTHPKAATGNYSVKIRVGDASFSKRLKIETVKPNRLEIEMDLDGKVNQVLNGRLETDVAVEWLTGLEASNTRLDIDASIVQKSMPFPKLKEFTFTDPARNFSTIKKQVFEGSTDEQGKVSASLDVGDFRYAPGMLKGRFVVKAFEAGGDFSTEYFDGTLAPFNTFVGVKLPKSKSYFLQTDKTHTVEIRTVDEEGNPKDISGLQVKVYKIDWHWWYDASGNYLNRYIDNEAVYLYDEDVVSTKNGKATFNLKVTYPAWGRFLVRVCDGKDHCGGKVAYFNWPEGVGGDRPEIKGATVLNFAPTKESYEVGEEVVTKIPVAEEGRVLVTVENGKGILKKEWLQTNGQKEVEYRFKAEPSMAPNVYISASFIQPYAQTKNDRPIRLYGIAPVKIVNPKSVLKPQIKSKDVWRPEEEVSVQVSETNGREMSYTLAIVDEGLLNLTRFQTPDPWNHFYAKEALGIKTFDLYSKVLGAFSGTLAQIFAIGGDGALNSKGLNNQNRFKPMVRHLGPFKLKAGETATHKVKLPNYVGKVRLMVVATADESAYGSVDKTVHIRKPLMVLSSLPRTFSPGEELSLPVTVFAMEDQVKTVKLKVKATGGVQIEGNATQTLTFDKVGQQVVDFTLKIPEQIGTSTIRIDASSGQEKAYDETQMVIRAPNPPLTEVETFFLEPGADTTLTYNPVGLASTNSVSVTGYGMPNFRLQERMKYLYGYPHGCGEQTVSRVYPLIYLDKLLNMTDNMKKERKQNIRIAFDKLYQLQRSDGGMRYWPGSSKSNTYLTTYAGAFMHEAKRKGYEVPSGFLPRYERYQRTTARAWRPRYYYGECTNCLDQAYRLRIMAEYGAIEVGAMNRLKGERLRRTELWNLAGAYAHANQKEVARELMTQAMTATYADYYYYYGSSLRNMATELEVLQLLGEDAEAFKRAQQICRDLNGNNHYATHSLALGLKAVLGYYTADQSDKVLGWSYKSDDLTKNMADVSSISIVEQKQSADKSYAFTVRNTGNSPMNFSLTRTGTPLRTSEEPSASGLSISVEYTDGAGGYIDVNNLKQGQDFIANVSIRRIGEERNGYKDLALTQIFPSGWEIINTRLTNENERSDSENGENGRTIPEYQDIRDDRVYTYFDLEARSSASFQMQLNATYAGRYYLPPVLVEHMYDNEIKAKTGSRWVEVIRQGN